MKESFDEVYRCKQFVKTFCFVTVKALQPFKKVLSLFGREESILLRFVFFLKHRDIIDNSFIVTVNYTREKPCAVSPSVLIMGKNSV